MDKFKEIRPIALGLAIRNNKVLVSEGFDKVKNEYFYRILGGGVEFLETSEQALVREFKEEINADIKITEKLDIEESVFSYDGKPAHEIVFMYKIEIPEDQIKDEYIIEEINKKSLAKWVNKEDFINDSKILYPEIIKKYL